MNPYKMRLSERIIPALGHIKLAKLQPHHLMEFYNNLGESGIRKDGRYTPTDTLLTLLDAYTTPALVALSGVSFKTCQRIKNGSPTTHETAVKICTAMKIDIQKMFTRDTDKKLSDKTVRHHHGVICSILSTAVKWNVLTGNPADRVDLGKMARYKPAYYDDEQLTAMFTALECEPFACL